MHTPAASPSGDCHKATARPWSPTQQGQHAQEHRATKHQTDSTDPQRRRAGWTHGLCRSGRPEQHSRPEDLRDRRLEGCRHDTHPVSHCGEPRTTLAGRAAVGVQPSQRWRREAPRLPIGRGIVRNLYDVLQSGRRSVTSGTITRTAVIIAGVGTDSSHSIPDPLTADCRRPGLRRRQPHLSGSSVEIPARSLLDGPCPVQLPHGRRHRSAGR